MAFLPLTSPFCYLAHERIFVLVIVFIDSRYPFGSPLCHLFLDWDFFSPIDFSTVHDYRLEFFIIAAWKFLSNNSNICVTAVLSSLNWLSSPRKLSLSWFLTCPKILDCISYILNIRLWDSRSFFKAYTFDISGVALLSSFLSMISLVLFVSLVPLFSLWAKKFILLCTSMTLSTY